MSSIRALLLATALLSLAACARPTYEKAAGLGINPLEQHPLRTIDSPEAILLSQREGGLSANQTDALRGVYAGWRERGHGRILIEAPSGAGPAAAATAYGARDALEYLGAPQGAIELVGYRVDGSPNAAPVRVSFLTEVADVAQCGRSWTDMTKTASNQPTPNFGCSVNANLAAMIDNPADINRPRGIDPVDAGRRQEVIDRYRQGQATSSEKDDQANGTVSRAVN